MLAELLAPNYAPEDDLGFDANYYNEPVDTYNEGVEHAKEVAQSVISATKAAAENTADAASAMFDVLSFCWYGE